MRDKWSLYNSGWNPNKKNVIVIHGFNGSENNKLMVILRNGNIYFLIPRDMALYYNLYFINYNTSTNNYLNINTAYKL